MNQRIMAKRPLVIVKRVSGREWRFIIKWQITLYDGISIIENCDVANISGVFDSKEKAREKGIEFCREKLKKGDGQWIG